MTNVEYYGGKFSCEITLCKIEKYDQTIKLISYTQGTISRCPDSNCAIWCQWCSEITSGMTEVWPRPHAMNQYNGLYFGKKFQYPQHRYIIWYTLIHNNVNAEITTEIKDQVHVQIPIVRPKSSHTCMCIADGEV